MNIEHKAEPILYKDLPQTPCLDSADKQRRERMFTYITRPMIDQLVKLFAGKRVLEAYAGRGHMSALLAERGIDIISTSLRQGHDGSYSLGHVFDVEDLDVVRAVDKYKDSIDALLVCWPTTDMGMYRALKVLPKHIPIVFIGEVTDYTISPPFLGGCACDDFFANTTEQVDALEGYKHNSFGQEKFKVFHRNEVINRPVEYGRFEGPGM